VPVSDTEDGTAEVRLAKQMEKKKATRGRKSSGRMASKGFPNPVDVHVGTRVRLRRTLLGLSQEKLGEAIGLTFQQVQKYERGANRVGSSRLYDLSRVLDVPIAYFFDEMPNGVQDKSPSRLMGLAHPPAVEYEPDPMAKRETLELVRAYYRITEPSVRKRLFDLIKSIARGLKDED
jgi:transcriptional regulator with XRE-family HTH domain